MSRLIETIKVENKCLVGMREHNLRFNESRAELFGTTDTIDLEMEITLPDWLTNAVYKCRVIYRTKVEEIQFELYHPRIIKSLQLVDGNRLDYHLKYENRSGLMALLTQKGEADDILIVKDGQVTDTSFSNVALFDGKRWVTPETCLLNGTQRRRMIDSNFLETRKITPNDLHQYAQIKPINTMLDFEDTPSVEILQQKDA